MWEKGCGCSTTVEHTPRNLEVVGLNPAGCSFFFFFLSLSTFLHQWSVLNQVPHGGASLAECYERNKKKWMPSWNAWCETCSISSDWVKKCVGEKVCVCVSEKEERWRERKREREKHLILIWKGTRMKHSTSEKFSQSNSIFCFSTFFSPFECELKSPASKCRSMSDLFCPQSKRSVVLLLNGMIHLFCPNDHLRGDGMAQR